MSTQHVCHACFSPAAKKCAHCHRATYCGAECQRAAWPQHREVCWDAASTHVDDVYAALLDAYDDVCDVFVPNGANGATAADVARINAVLNELALAASPGEHPDDLRAALQEAHAEIARVADAAMPRLTLAATRAELQRCVDDAAVLHSALDYDPAMASDEVREHLAACIEASRSALRDGYAGPTGPVGPAYLRSLWVGANGAARAARRARRKSRRRSRRAARKEKRRAWAAAQRAERAERAAKRKLKRRQRKEKRAARKAERKRRSEPKGADGPDAGASTAASGGKGGDAAAASGTDRVVSREKRKAEMYRQRQRDAEARKAELDRQLAGDTGAASGGDDDDNYVESQLRMGVLLNAHAAAEAGDTRSLQEATALLESGAEMPRVATLRYLIGGRVYRARMYARLLLPGGRDRVRRKFAKYRSEGKRGRDKLADIAKVARTLQKRALGRRRKAMWGDFADEVEQQLAEFGGDAE